LQQQHQSEAAHAAVGLATAPATTQSQTDLKTQKIEAFCSNDFRVIPSFVAYAYATKGI
jgi:hypothetical protein